jgi:FTR1 family protein
LRQVFVGVSIAVAICVAVGVALQVISRALLQLRPEGLETVVGTIAVVMVTYKVLRMRRHARDSRSDLEGGVVAFNRDEGMEQRENGAWESPNGDLVAWFTDPFGNTLSLTSFLAS